MQIISSPLAPGLYFVATPIGSARDITLRALDILASADVIAAEDTRTVKHLMRLHGVALGDRRVIAYHDHSGDTTRRQIVALIGGGKSVAYVSEAGTPLVADPGYQLGRAVIAENLPVTSAPGPSALLAALTVSGLPSDRFLFAGFPPAAAAARGKWLRELADVRATVVIYDSPKRIQKILEEMVQYFGPERQTVICRELTKRFEEVTRGTLAQVGTVYSGRLVKGEVVVLVDRPKAPVADAVALEDALRVALKDGSVKDAVAYVSGMLSLPKRQVYQAALQLHNDRKE